MDSASCLLPFSLWFNSCNPTPLVSRSSSLFSFRLFFSASNFGFLYYSFLASHLSAARAKSKVWSRSRLGRAGDRAGPVEHKNFDPELAGRTLHEMEGLKGSEMEGLPRAAA
jgi:hypothetical protein